MFLMPLFRVPWTWAMTAFLLGAVALAYPLLRTTQLVRNGDVVTMQRSNAFFAVLLVLARVPPIGRPIKGAWRWIDMGPLTLQPSELAKIAVILGLAAYGHAFRRRMAEVGMGLLLPGALVSVMLGLVLLGKDLGTTALLALAHELNAEGRYAALVVSAETGAPFSDDPDKSERALLAAGTRTYEL